MLLYIYTDGASRNNPGRSASGYAIFDKSYKELFSEVFYNGIKTNNAAEYIALIAALGKAEELYGSAASDVSAFSDSVLMVQQVSGVYKTKNQGLKVLNNKAIELAGRFKSFTIKSVPRENAHIAEVDAALNALLDDMESGNHAIKTHA